MAGEDWKFDDETGSADDGEGFDFASDWWRLAVLIVFLLAVLLIPALTGFDLT